MQVGQKSGQRVHRPNFPWKEPNTQFHPYAAVGIQKFHLRAAVVKYLYSLPFVQIQIQRLSILLVFVFVFVFVRRCVWEPPAYLVLTYCPNADRAAIYSQERLRSAAFIRPVLIKILRKNWCTPTASRVCTLVLMVTQYFTIQRLGANYET